MADFLDKLIADAEERIMRGYYDEIAEVKHEHLSLSRAIKNSNHNAIIAEIKPKSPARNTTSWTGCERRSHSACSGRSSGLISTH